MKIKEFEEIITQLDRGHVMILPVGLTVKKAHGMAATIGSRNNMEFWVFSAPDFIVRKK